MWGCTAGRVGGAAQLGRVGGAAQQGAWRVGRHMQHRREGGWGCTAARVGGTVQQGG